ncbi:MAG: hypothetical protein INR73_26435 [Williamsia sp.]|nr:hypothetical protein [Williamsia sp.]
MKIIPVFLIGIFLFVAGCKSGGDDSRELQEIASAADSAAVSNDISLSSSAAV